MALALPAKLDSVGYMMLSRIHSLNGRDNTLLPWLWSSAGEDAVVFRSEMQQTVGHLSSMLATRGVDYSKLKSALVPSDKGLQIAFLYDWSHYPSGNYAVDFAELWLSSLRADIRTTVLSGDLLPGGRPSETYLDEVVHRADTFPVQWNTLFAVYFSSLNSRDLAAIHERLKRDPRYRGYLDVTFGSMARNYLSRTLTFPHVIFEKKIVTAHDEDDLVVGNRDPVGYPFAEHGFDVVALHNSYVLALLHYKIESDDSPDLFDDLKYSLAAISGETLGEGEIDVLVDPRKVEQYLLKDKSKMELMKSVGLESVTATELAAVISKRVRKNYIYDLRPAGDGITPAFAVSAEFQKPDGSFTKRLVALKFDADQHSIALVSMY